MKLLSGIDGAVCGDDISCIIMDMCYQYIGPIYVGYQIGTGPVLELGATGRPVMELGCPQLSTEYPKQAVC